MGNSLSYIFLFKIRSVDISQGFCTNTKHYNFIMFIFIEIQQKH
jgi:hypothetical protein